MIVLTVSDDLKEVILSEVQTPKPRDAEHAAYLERVRQTRAIEAEQRKFANLLMAEVHRLQRLTPEMLFGPGRYGMKNDKIVSVYPAPLNTQDRLVPMLLCSTIAQAQNFTKAFKEENRSCQYLLLVIAADGITVDLL